MKKFYYLTLVLVLSILTLNLTSCSNKNDLYILNWDEYINEDLIEEFERQLQPDSLEIIEDMAIQFFPTTAFTKVSICCPSYSDNNGTLTFSLYSWMGTYEDTMAGKAIKTATFENYRDNELLTLSFDKALPDGEYVLLLSTPDYSDGVGTWCKACSFEGQKIYVDGGGSLPENTELHVELRVSYVNTPKNLYGKVSK